jgi:hypothetical protein
LLNYCPPNTWKLSLFPIPIFEFWKMVTNGFRNKNFRQPMRQGDGRIMGTMGEGSIHYLFMYLFIYLQNWVTLKRERDRGCSFLFFAIVYIFLSRLKIGIATTCFKAWLILEKSMLFLFT